MGIINCSVKNCTNGKYSIGLCKTHYMTAYRLRKSGRPASDPAIGAAVPKRHGAYEHCQKCERTEIHGRGLCGTHYAQMLRARKKQNETA